MKTLTSHEGVDLDTVDNDSIMNPPTEYHEEAHPESHTGSRYKESRKILDSLPGKTPSSSHIHDDEPERPNLAAENQPPTDKENESDRTILLVEDNLINQKVLRRQLQARGFHVVVASDGQQAIDEVRRRGEPTPNPSSHRNYFDCILMDHEMPIKDGSVASTEIREIQAQGDAGRSPILGVSANVREAQKDAMIEAGMDAVISKPFKVDELVEKMKSLMPE